MRCLFFILFLSALSISHAQQKTTLEEGFMSPPDSIRTGTFWYWISDNISKEGAIADLDKATTLKPEHAGAHELFGDALMQAGKEAEAALQWRVAEELRKKRSAK